MKKSELRSSHFAAYPIVGEQATNEVDSWLSANDVVVAALELNVEPLHVISDKTPSNLASGCTGKMSHSLNSRTVGCPSAGASGSFAANIAFSASVSGSMSACTTSWSGMIRIVSLCLPSHITRMSVKCMRELVKQE